MKRLHLRIPFRDEWWKFFDSNVAGGGVFCPTGEAPEVGSEVRLEVTFIGGPRILLRGIVMWRRPQLNDPRARAGVGVKINATDRAKLEYVNAWVRGGMLDKRELRRLPVRLRVTYSARSGRRINFTRDLSEDGIFIRSQELLDLDTPIQLLISPPGDGFKPYALKGVVARLVDEPEERGMGIRLQFKDDAERELYESFVQRLEDEYLAGALADDIIS